MARNGAASVLVTWIGQHDLDAPSCADCGDVGPVAQALKERRFDRACLLTDYPTAKSEPYFKWLNAQTKVPIQVEQIKLTSPVEYGEIFEAVDGVLRRLKEQSTGDLRLTYHLSPGSPAMAFVSLALFKPVLKVLSEYLGLALTAPQVQSRMQKTGTGIQHLHLQDLRKVPVPLAPLDEQAEVERQLVARGLSLRALSDAVRGAHGRLGTLDQSILAKAFRGELVPQDPNDEP